MLVDIFWGFIMLILFASWLGAAICMINFGRLLQKSRSNPAFKPSLIPFSHLFGTYDDERMTFWRKGMIIWASVFLGLMALCLLFSWLSGGTHA
jgi:hypothetical protein